MIFFLSMIDVNIGRLDEKNILIITLRVGPQRPNNI